MQPMMQRGGRTMVAVVAGTLAYVAILTAQWTLPRRCR